MFDFLKKFKFLNNNNDIVKKISYGDSNGVSYVCDNNTIREINRWIKLIGIDNFYFSELLYELGFDKNKCLSLKIISNDGGNLLLSFQYDGELSKGEKMEICFLKKFSSLDSLEPNSYGIVISGDDYEEEYRLIVDKSFENGRWLVKEKDYIKENIGSCIYRRVIQKNGFQIVINNDYFKEIKLVCYKKDILLKNELELKEYLLKIDDNVSVIEIYKKICEISLGNENEYDEIKLTLQKDDKVVGSIEIKGKCRYVIFEHDYKYELLENGNKCILTCDYGSKRKVINFTKNDYNIKIEMSFDDKIFNDKIVLREYFMNLEYPIKINELCRDFRDKFLIDLNSIPYFKIEIYNDNKYCDNLLIKNGEIHKFEMTIGDKNLFLSADGMFYYSSSSLKGEVEVDMSFNDDVVTRYEVALDNGIVNDDMGNIMYNHINSAVKEKVRVRKMVDEILNKDNS